MLFIQMSGFPGSGKSTLALEIAKSTGAIIIDHDVGKTALLETDEGAKMDGHTSGKISYMIDWAIIESLLYQGQKVIFDSPCLYDEMVQKGASLAEKFKVKYKYVECCLDDFNEINRRLKNRERKISQIESVHSLEAFRNTIESSKKPVEYPCLVVDTSKPLETYIDKVIDYLNE
ncbi:ATP-binding protein [Bacillus sp. AFS015802]|uniref:AAA family ATPase n=1 Tax=Bacillus sp. AFS015802 TaxID=2033486 RepID=UPI000BFA1680|nr:AAA family ATPase [Bacillus sp. AFS015802]PFA69181.1 ATP-binding protein [Bacillus sp. AFS015802]